MGTNLIWKGEARPPQSFGVWTLRLGGHQAGSHCTEGKVRSLTLGSKGADGMNERASPKLVLIQRVLGTAGEFRLCPGNNGEATLRPQTTTVTLICFLAEVGEGNEVN